MYETLELRIKFACLEMFDVLVLNLRSIGNDDCHEFYFFMFLAFGMTIGLLRLY